jgi:hypothetical protein
MSKKADRAVMKDELVAEWKALNLKYPKEVYSKLRLEPLDILAYVRKLIDYGSRFNVSEREYNSLAWNAVPIAYLNEDGSLKRTLWEINMGLPPDEPESGQVAVA